MARGFFARGEVTAPVANTASVATTVDGQWLCINAIRFSYSADPPANTRWKIEENGITVASGYVTKSGQGFIPLHLENNPSTRYPFVATLPAGGGGVFGIIDIDYVPIS